MQDNQRITNLEQSVKQLTEQQEMTSESIEELREKHDNLVASIEKDDSATAHELAEMKSTLSSIKDLLQAWNDAKGFVKWIGYLATFAKWLTIIGGSCALIWAALKAGIEPDSIKDIKGGK